MSTGTLSQHSLGIRSVGEVRRVLMQLRARRDKPRVRGAAAALRWALDPRQAPPLLMEPAPADGLRRLMAQERTALAVRRDPLRTPPERRQARGVAEALGWILGYSPDPPA